jgi:DNA-binding CsgD family transcriptional regulator
MATSALMVPNGVLNQVGLTAREREVMRLVARGLTNEEIGERLSICYSTAKTHVNRAMMKTGSRDRSQLVILAYETGLVRVGEPEELQPPLPRPFPRGHSGSDSGTATRRGGHPAAPA